MVEFNYDSRFDLKLRQGQDAEGRLAQILLGKGSETTVEVKTEPRYTETGNLAIEFSQSAVGGGKKPSGIHPSATESQWWAVEWMTDRWLILPTATMREIARTEWRLSGSRPMGDNGNEGVLVPLASIISPWLIPPAERQDQEPLRRVA